MGCERNEALEPELLPVTCGETFIATRHVLVFKYGRSHKLCGADVHSTDAASDPFVNPIAKTLPCFGEGYGQCM